jgi:hypothetical protein
MQLVWLQSTLIQEGFHLTSSDKTGPAKKTVTFWLVSHHFSKHTSAECFWLFLEWRRQPCAIPNSLPNISQPHTGTARRFANGLDSIFWIPLLYDSVCCICCRFGRLSSFVCAQNALEGSMSQKYYVVPHSEMCREHLRTKATLSELGKNRMLQLHCELQYLFVVWCHCLLWPGLQITTSIQFYPFLPSIKCNQCMTCPGPSPCTQIWGPRR